MNYKIKKSDLVIIFLLIAALAAAYAYKRYTQRAPTFTQGMVGKVAPEFNLPASKGGQINLADYKGKLVLLNFWASWCPPCRAEMPGFIKLQEAYKDKPFQIIGAALEDKRSADQFADEIGVNYPYAFGLEAINDRAVAFGNADGALPYSVLISPDQKILSVYFGFISEDKLKKMIDENIK